MRYLPPTEDLRGHGVPDVRRAGGTYREREPRILLRQKGRWPRWPWAIQGGTSALIAMGALQMGLTEEELPDIVQRWRQANPRN